MNTAGNGRPSTADEHAMTTHSLSPDQTGILFQAERLTKSFGEIGVLDNLSFDIPLHQIVAFVGENGAGKSTLMNILSGIIAPATGNMRLSGQPYAPSSYQRALQQGVSRVFQEQALINTIPVYENMLLGTEGSFTRAGQWLDKKHMITVAQDMITAAGFDIDVRRRTGDYDFSTRQSIEITRACLAPEWLYHQSTPLVLLDEPTSALDRRDEERFFTLIRQIRQRGALLFISHRMSEVMQCSDLIYVLKDGKLIARLPTASTSEKELHSLMVGRIRAADYYHENRQLAVSQAEVRLDVCRLQRKNRFTDISLQVRAGEILGIGGLLDSGKSALGKAIAGISKPDHGVVSLMGEKAVTPDIIRFSQAGLGYIPAERLTEGIIAAFPVAWNFSLASGGDLFSTPLGLWRSEREQTETARYIEKLHIRSASPLSLCRRLSGGNQQKVVLARWICRHPRVLILDNPTRGVDAGAKEEIYRFIRDLSDAGIAILLITDELLELIGLSHRIVVMRRGEAVKELPAPANDKPTERDILVWMLPDESAVSFTGAHNGE